MSKESDAELARSAAVGQQRKAAETGDPADREQASRMQSSADKMADESRVSDDTQFDD